MRFYDFEQIYIGSHGNPDILLELFYRKPYTGNNFILKPEALVDAFWVSNQHKSEYLGLCSFRSYSIFKETGELDLSLDRLPPWVPHKIVAENPLVQLTNSKIIFIKEK